MINLGSAHLLSLEAFPVKPRLSSTYSRTWLKTKAGLVRRRFVTINNKLTAENPPKFKKASQPTATETWTKPLSLDFVEVWTGAHFFEMHAQPGLFSFFKTITSIGVKTRKSASCTSGRNRWVVSANTGNPRV